MEEENKHCYSCQYYRPYYIKSDTQFDRCDIGLCKKSKATVEKHEACEKYSFFYRGRVSRRQLTLTAITEHINLLSELKQILDEDDDEAIKELFLEFKKRKR